MTIEDFEKTWGEMRPLRYYITKYGEGFRELIIKAYDWLREMKPQWQVAWTVEDDDAFFGHLVS